MHLISCVVAVVVFVCLSSTYARSAIARMSLFAEVSAIIAKQMRNLDVRRTRAPNALHIYVPLMRVVLPLLLFIRLASLSCRFAPFEHSHSLICVPRITSYALSINGVSSLCTSQRMCAHKTAIACLNSRIKAHYQHLIPLHFMEMSGIRFIRFRSACLAKHFAPSLS